MGIRGLSAAVRRYGIFGPLSGYTVVIDGPALVFQVLDGCMNQRPATNGFICQPSYPMLGRMVIGWLEELRRHNITVRKIYFDGYLPPSKWQVRRERLLRQSQLMKGLLTSHPHGSSQLPEDAFDTIKAEIALTQSFGHSSRFSWLPKPPFLVPAVIETLKSCHTWGPLVEVVSGEADMFCAEDVRRYGGVLLTSDSDLLITDLGPNGNVAFFTDVVEANQSDKSEGLVACKFSLNTINDTLGLNNVGGLPRVAFEIVRSRISFNEALKRARSRNDNTLESFEFQNFREEYFMKEYLPKDHPVQKMLSGLDPRISEIVIQTLLLDGNGTVPDASSRGPETLAMFLPVMIEVSPPPHFISFEACLKIMNYLASRLRFAVRQLAYSIMQTVAVHQSPVVIEYRLLEAFNSLTGRQIDVPGSEEALEQCHLLADTLKEITKRMARVDMQWLAFAIYQDVMWSTSEERLPLSASLISKLKSAPDDRGEHSWDIIHFTAQVHASLYSLRMAHQLFDVAVSLCPSLPPAVRELHGHLSALPAIADWPTVENMSQALAAAAEVNILSVITDILGIVEIEAPTHSSEANQSKKRKIRNGLLRSERDPKRPTSINPFAVLSHASLG
ncbi:hypothetical protein E0Z10_g2071 [Xylaria hypoxylon]|uniref:Asteroid domain-containing protein n=1 Tax=Xylaria hypoxylon TaxID=37992 RepID=A0A4Z0YQU5_9PEZI|nr:hypothetical protein E0Z10_g2071 [Xylaria hypoxylon]